MARLSLDRIVAAARRRRGDLLAIAVIVLVAIAFLAPALKDGPSYGGFDLDTTRSTLGVGVYRVIHAYTNGDAVSQMVSWNDLSWRLVHAGEFPWWNQYEALGMPQFLNFESSVLSLPDLVSYLAPLRDAFLVVILVKLWLAGLGAYLFARVCRCRPLSALIAGLGFMLAGAYANWVTWPLSDVLAWIGFVAAFGLLAFSPRGRPRHVAGLAVSVAFSIYGGFPEANVMLVIALAVMTVVALAWARRMPSLPGVLRAGAGAVIGVALAAPLWLPGLDLIKGSYRNAGRPGAGLPLKALPLMLAQGYYGLPTGPAHAFGLGGGNNYYESVSYLGVVLIALALVAIISALRRPIVAGLSAALLVSLGLTYEPGPFHPLFTIVNRIPELDTIRFERMRTVTAFLVAALAAIGLEQLLARIDERRVRTAFVVSSSLVTAAVAYLVVDTLASTSVRDGRLAALGWPIGLSLGTLVLAIVLWFRGRDARPPLVATVLVVAQVMFLFVAGVGIPSYSSAFYEATSSIAKLQSIVGSSLVGLDGGNTSDVRDFEQVGFYPNINIGYSVRLFGIHDPLMPAAYYRSWPVQAATPHAGGVSLFSPDIDSVALARRYGIAYILTKQGLKPPSGTRVVVVLNGETLSQVPSSPEFSFSSTSGDQVRLLSSDGDGSWTLRTSGSEQATLVMRVTDLPGMHATIDGKALSLEKYDDVMMQASIPQGSHTIVLTYRPRRLLEGVGVALGGLVALGILGAVPLLLARRRHRAEPTSSAVVASQ